MARPPQSLKTHFLCYQNHRSIQNPNPQTQNIGLNNGGKKFLLTHQQPKAQSLTQIAKEVSRVIRTQPRWEQTLLSDFLSINLFDPNFFIELWKQQNNVLLSLRFYLWLSSQRSFVSDKLARDVIFDGVVKAKAANAAKSFLTFVDFTPQPGSLKAYVRRLCENGSIEKALKVFDELQKLGICPLLETWNSALLGSVRARRTDVVWKLIGNLKEVKELYNEMCCKGYKETTVSCNTMIRGLCLHGRTEEAHVLFQEMAENRIARDIITYNSLIQGFCKEGKIDESINLLAELLEKGLQPSAATYTASLEKLCEMGDVDEAKELWEDMQKRGVEPAVCTRDFIITRLSNKGYVAERMEWLAAMLRQKGLQPSAATYTAPIEKLCEMGDVDEAKELWEDMQKRGVEPAVCTHDFIITRLSNKGYVAERMEWLAAMLRQAKAANAAKSFLTFVDFTPQPGSLEAYVRCLRENGTI
ncbi:hypothetical protein TEA_002411 [Camellia sinensis var. sinensis]|uniref:Pentacotripeptide-repeat region of PRORP domain-containing protein n=1 Tax=Camellia sinensis var. sinensis TaxID=542762 RepID=A0A4S4DW96_CAMSN|nr:hypothetical protein TEA_002411 [Camellia sinensis var. sinensis]